MKKLVSLLLAGIMSLSLIVPAFAAGLSGQITASGSSALLPLVKFAAEQFRKTNPNMTINVTAGGSFTGLKQVEEGAVDIGNSDVKATDDDLVEHKVAIMPFIFIVNPDVSVTNLTQKQAIDIFAGNITNWKDVGGADKAITIVQRKPSSGSRATILNTVMNGNEFTNNAIVQSSNGEVKATVASTPGSIGYVDLPYVDSSVKALKYKGYACTEANLINGKYSIYAVGRMYTKGAPSALERAFINYIRSTSFQNKYLKQMGYIPIAKEDQIDDTPKPAPKPFVVKVNGKAQVLAGVKPYVFNNNTYVSTAFLNKNMGYTTTYNTKSKQLTIKAKGKSVTLWVGKKSMKVGTKTTALAAAPVIKNGSVMVPINLIASQFGGKVTWDSKNNTVSITK